MQAIIGKLAQKAIKEGFVFRLRFDSVGKDWLVEVEPEFTGGDDDERGAMVEDRDLGQALSELEWRLGEAGWQ
jgi:hypothetical protein